MGIVKLLSQIRPGWISRVSHQLARGAGVRAVLQDELEEFYDSLQQAVETGNPSWLDSILGRWNDASVEEPSMGFGANSVSPLISKLLLVTQEFALETLLPSDALELVTGVMPMFTYAFEYCARVEVENKVGRVATELAIAQKTLKTLDKTKSDFIAVAAHELKTPLTLIEGYAAMLREQFPKDDEYSTPVLMLKGVDNGTTRLREIVDDMIDVSLIDNNLLSLNYQPFWINRLFEALEIELQETVEQRKLTLNIKEFPGNSEMTFGDAERIHQAFRNLLTNAIKFTPDGGTIEVTGRKLQGFVEVIVKDTGIGIDPEYHTRIFQKFGQLGNVSLHSSGKTKFKGGGPGLGLPITRGIIEAHGGSIWVESEGYDEEKCPGSVFHVMLPLRKQPPDATTAEVFKELTDLYE